MLPDYPHLLATGELVVAERAGRVLGFAGAVVRSDVVFLTDLFVREERQGGKLGGRLLRHILAPHGGRARFTVSSTDPRALALYIRARMLPLWPNFLLRARSADITGLLVGDAVAAEADPADPDLIAWDAAASGRDRPQDHAYWRREEGGVPLWVRRGRRRAGYAYVRLRAGTLYHPEAVRIGPVGTRRPEDAAACVAAAVRWATERGPILRIDVPAPHPSLAPLLDAGFRITYVETLVSSAAAPIFDAARYLGSGGSLF